MFPRTSRGTRHGTRSQINISVLEFGVLAMMERLFVKRIQPGSVWLTSVFHCSVWLDHGAESLFSTTGCDRMRRLKRTHSSAVWQVKPRSDWWIVQRRFSVSSKSPILKWSSKRECPFSLMWVKYFFYPYCNVNVSHQGLHFGIILDFCAKTWA